jgi:hypothetical protein
MTVDDDKHTLRTWVGLSEPFDWRKRSYLGPLLSVVGVMVVGGLFTLAIAAAFKLLGSAVFGGLPQGAASNFGLTGIIVAMIGAPFVVWRAVVAQKQVNVAEQGQITDRISKAVEGLGTEKTVKNAGEETTKPNLEVRIGAIYALERIAQDSLRDHIQVMEILCAYIRENAPCDEIAPKVIPEMRAITRSDIQTAITVLGRRTSAGKGIEAQRRFRLNLRNVDLSGASFENGDFTATDFRASKLEGSIFNFSTIKGCKMQSANLRYASFQDADLTGSRLDHAIIEPSHKFDSINRANLNGVSCSIPDDHIDPRRWALFAARWVLGDSRKEKRHARTTA